MPDWPSMEDSREATLRRAARKADDRTSQEYLLYVQQMAGVREAAKFSGIPEWTREHTIGGLFACQALRSSLKVLHDMNAIGHATYSLMRQLIEEQEIITVQMEQGE